MKRLPLFILILFLLSLQPLRAQVVVIVAGSENKARGDNLRTSAPVQRTDTSFVGGG